MLISDAITFGRNELKNDIEVRLLLSHSINQNIEYILANPDQSLSKNEIDQYKSFISRRSAKEPIAYILGYREFYGRDFAINSSVLIPRNDSETIIDAVLSVYSKDEEIKILELGIGSGCLAITLLMEIRNATAWGVDISDNALKIAKQNIDKFELEKRCNVIQSNWFDSINMDQKFDLIISNPPYISESEKNIMAEETILFEPDLALYAENNGLDSYHEISRNAKNFLNQNGKVFVEIGMNQEGKVGEIFQENGLDLIKQYKDLSGIIRVLEFG